MIQALTYVGYNKDCMDAAPYDWRLVCCDRVQKHEISLLRRQFACIDVPSTASMPFVPEDVRPVKARGPFVGQPCRC